MNELLTKSDIRMTSLDIAGIVGKKHYNVMRDVREEVKQLGEEDGRLIFEESSYTNSQNKKQPCYEFGKQGAMQLALKYDAKTRFKVIKRIEELESGISNQLPGTYKEALIQLVGQVEENEKLETNKLMLEQRVSELKPKADYTDVILKNKGLVLISQIAKDYGMTANKMNKVLHELRVQYKRGRQWLLYANYHDKGYTHSETFEFTRRDGTKDVDMTTKWTQRGRLFLYDLLKENEIVPVIERQVD